MWVYPGLRRANTTKVVGIYLANKGLGGGRTIVSYPDPLQLSKRKEGSGEYSTMFLYLLQKFQWQVVERV